MCFTQMEEERMVNAWKLYPPYVCSIFMRGWKLSYLDNYFDADPNTSSAEKYDDLELLQFISHIKWEMGLENK